MQDTVTRSSVNWLAHWAEVSPGDAALVIGQRGKVSFGDLAQSVARMAKLLAAAGVAPGMLVGIETADQAGHVAALLACEALGVCTVSFSAEDLATGDALVGRCEWVLCDGAPQAAAAPGRWVRLDAGFAAQMAATVLGAEDWARLTRPMAPDAIARLTRSSGTTGARKVFAQSAGQIANEVATRWGLYGPKNRAKAVICLYPFPSYVAYHNMLASLYNGSALHVVSLDHFDRVVVEVPSFHVSVVQGQLPMLIDKYRLGLEFAPLRTLSIIGAEVPAGLWPQLSPTRFARAFNAYTASEVHTFSFSTNGEPYTILDDAEARIVDEMGRPVAFGTAGLIEIRTPRMTKGYLWNPELTQKHFVGGWFRTYDIGFMPAPGRLVVGGRGDDILNVGGTKILPGMYEAKLRDLAEIKDAVLITLHDHNRVDHLHVVIEGDGLTLNDALVGKVLPLVAGICDKCWVHVLNPLPRTETGKVRRIEIRELLEKQAKV